MRERNTQQGTRTGGGSTKVTDGHGELQGGRQGQIGSQELGFDLGLGKLGEVHDVGSVDLLLEQLVGVPLADADSAQRPAKNLLWRGSGEGYLGFVRPVHEIC
jgi:hypothetical protein